MSQKEKMVHLRKRLPDILLESLFIVLALLGALALDEWRETKKQQELAKTAITAIRDEMSKNLKQLEERLEAHQELLDELKQKLEQLKANPEEKVNFSFSFSMALISSAVWDSARMTQSIQVIPLEDVSRFAKVYKFQELFSDHQKKIIDKVMMIGELDEDDFPHFAKGFSHRLEILININKDLQGAYQNTLGRKIVQPD